MAAVWCTLYLATLLTIGLALASGILGGRKLSIIELGGVVIGLGMGAGSGLLLLISLCGIAPGRIVILTLLVLALAILVLLWQVGRLIRFSLPQLDRRTAELLLIPGLLGLMAGVIVVTILAIRFPIFNWDSIVIWGLKAKVLYYAPLTPRPWYFSEYRYSYSHLDYPLLMPMMLTGAYAMLHAINEPPARVIFPVLFLGQLLLFYSGARLVISRIGAVYLSTIVLCSPFMVQQASMGTADMPLATFCTGTAVYLFRWSIQRRRADAILLALFTLFGALTKAEGLPLALITALLTAIMAAAWRTRRQAIDLAIILGILVVGLGIWLSWRAGIPHTDENYVGHSSLTVITSNLPRIGMILKNLWRFGTNFRSFGFIWILIPSCALLGFRAFRRPQTWILWGLLLLHLSAYIFAYIITPWNPQELINNSLNRLLSHLATTAGLVIAVHLASLNRNPTSEAPAILE